VTVAYIGLGANLDAPRQQVRQALAELATLPETIVLKTSSEYRSAPVGYSEQPEFINAVALLETGLAPERLLGELQALEARHGRQRSFPNAPRTLDLDLLLYGERIIDTDALKVPHPRMHERAFVLVPLLELAPEVAIPGHGPAARLLERCRDQKVERLH